VVRAGGVQLPLEDVPVDRECAGEVAVTMALLDRADVHDQGAGSDLGRQVGWLHRSRPLRAVSRSAAMAAERVMAPPKSEG